MAFEFLELIESLKEEIKEENVNNKPIISLIIPKKIDKEEVLAIFKEIQLLEQEKLQAEEEDIESGTSMEESKENKNNPQHGNFDKDSTSTTTDCTKENNDFDLQNGNTQ